MNAPCFLFAIFFKKCEKKRIGEPALDQRKITERKIFFLNFSAPNFAPHRGAEDKVLFAKQNAIRFSSLREEKRREAKRRGGASRVAEQKGP